MYMNSSSRRWRRAVGVVAALAIGVGAATSAVAAEKRHRWKMQSAVPKAFPILGPTGEHLAQKIEIVTGGTLRLGRQLWPKLSGDLSASYTDTQDDLLGDQVLIRLGASLQYELAEDVTTSLTYSFLDRSGDDGGGGLAGGDLDLRENVVTVRLLKEF